jgi:hypothetical protein
MKTFATLLARLTPFVMGPSCAAWNCRSPGSSESLARCGKFPLRESYKAVLHSPTSQKRGA